MGQVTCSGFECSTTVRAAASLHIAQSARLLGSDVRVSSARTMTIGGEVSANGQGYSAEAGPGGGSRGRFCESCVSDITQFSCGGGAGHGGNGSAACAKAAVHSTLVEGGSGYGATRGPTTFGSGGGNGCWFWATHCEILGGSGGGRVYLEASRVDIPASGKVTVDGQPGSAHTWVGFTQSVYHVGGGGGSGGSVWVTAPNGIHGAGEIRANGGDSVRGSGAGAGGRIAL
eukprot:2111553-Rhodomonas_salina.1